MFTDLNIYPTNNKTDPDPLFDETDPRIRIHIKMKNEYWGCVGKKWKRKDEEKRLKNGLKTHL